MATAITDPRKTWRSVATLPGRRFDHIFFPAMALLILGTAFLGFARTYYLAGLFLAKLPSPIIHIHAAAFSCWILLLVTQTSLVSAGRTDLHRRLGIAGFLLAGLMVVLGILAATNALIRRFPLDGDPELVYFISLTDMLIFAILVGFAFASRSHAAAHKRLILIATIALLIAPIIRWPFVIVHGNELVATVFSYIFLVILVGYDLWSTHRVHGTTLGAGAFLIFVQLVRVPIGKTAFWHAVANWVQSAMR